MLVTSSLLLVGCSKLPPAPEMWQCGHNVDGSGFYCVNTKTGESKVLTDSDPIMHGAQCLSIDDYAKAQSYIDTLEELAKQSCK